MSLSTIVYTYELLCASIEDDRLSAEYHDVVVEGLVSAYGVEAYYREVAAADVRVRGAYLDLFEREPVVTERLLDYLCDGDYLALEFTARRHLRLDEGRARHPVRRDSIQDLGESEELFTRVAAGYTVPLARATPLTVLCPAA